MLAQPSGTRDVTASAAVKGLTNALRPWETATVTVEYLVAYAPIPCSFARFTCRCGAFSVECDVRRGAPDNWNVAEDGSHPCPHCAPSAKQAP